MRIRMEEKNYIYAIPQKIRLRFYIKRMIRIFGGMWFGFLNLFFKPAKMSKKRYYVSICAMFRDEDKYLKEWIEFHRIIGIDHLYLYNNFSVDNYLDILTTYVDEGFVTLIDWPVELGQLSAYRDCVKKYGNESNWIGFIDLDEFVVPNKYDNIKVFLKRYERHGSVMLYWRYFGTSGAISRELKSLVVERFTVCWEKYANIGKCFFNTDYELDTNYPKNSIFHHSLWAKYKNIYYPPVNEFHKYVILDNHCFLKQDLAIQINHYLLKSYDEYISRKSKKGGGTHGVGMHDMNYFYEHEALCQGTDYHAFKYLVKLKLALRSEDDASRKKEE